MATAAAPGGAAVGSAMEEEQQAAGVGILLQISMLVLSFVLGHLLRRRRLYYIPEASASLLIGMTLLRPRPFPLFCDSALFTLMLGGQTSTVC
jgi:hypothetical protein